MSLPSPPTIESEGSPTVQVYREQALAVRQWLGERFLYERQELRALAAGPADARPPGRKRSAAAHANTTTMKNFHCRLTAGDYHAGRMKMMVGQAVVTIYLFALIVTLPQIALTDDADAHLSASVQYAEWSARALSGDRR